MHVKTIELMYSKSLVQCLIYDVNSICIIFYFPSNILLLEVWSMGQ